LFSAQIFVQSDKLTASKTRSRLITPTATPETGQASYLYDGDGNLARGIVNGVMTFYPGRHYNHAVDGTAVTVKKFYTLGSTPAGGFPRRGHRLWRDARQLRYPKFLFSFQISWQFS